MSFLGMGPMELGVILIVALIIFGPDKLPEIGSQIGIVVRDFRNATGDLTGEFQEAVSDFKGVANEVKQATQEVQDSTRALTRLDQQITPASAPSRPLPTETNVHSSAPAEPTKADPLADLMG